jgi:hypothetical protein
MEQALNEIGIGSVRTVVTQGHAFAGPVRKKMGVGTLFYLLER